MKKNKSALARFFSHNITLLVLSFLIAFVAWFIISVNPDTEYTATMTDLPVEIELSQNATDDGLEIFSGNDVTASVDVQGSRTTIGMVSRSKNDYIQVSAAQASTITEPGTYTLSLSAKKIGTTTNYSIISTVTPSTITILVDRRKEATFDIENKLVYQVNEGYYVNAALSESKVTLNGPETEINKVAFVQVAGTVDGVITDARTVTKNLIYLDENGTELELEPTVEADIDSVDVTLTVYPMKEITLMVDAVNAPKNFTGVTIEPAKLTVAAPQELLDSDSFKNDSFHVGTIDFQKLQNKKEIIEFPINLPSNVRNLSNESTATATVDLSAYTKGSVTCKVLSGLDTSKYKVDYTNTVELTVFGPKAQIEKLSASDVRVTLDYSDVDIDITDDKTHSYKVPLIVTFTKEAENCWAYIDFDTYVNVALK